MIKAFFVVIFDYCKSLRNLLHVVILLLSLVLIACVTADCYYYNTPFEASGISQQIQLWISLFFMADIVLDVVLYRRGGTYFFTYLILFLCCVPYNDLLPYLSLKLPHEIAYLLRFLPLIRSVYAFAIVVSWFTTNRVTRTFVTYLSVLVAGIYLSSLAFYVCEQGANPLVKNYDDALWWAAMQATTVGSNIIAVTALGKILSFVVALLGIMMFPMFTVYVTNGIGSWQRIAKAQRQLDEESLRKNFEDNPPARFLKSKAGSDVKPK